MIDRTNERTIEKRGWQSPVEDCYSTAAAIAVAPAAAAAYDFGKI